MKKLIKWLSATGLVVGLLTGCATSNWQTTTGKSLVTIAQTVETARQGWVAYCNIKGISASDSRNVKFVAIYAEYQTAFAAALAGYTAAVNSNDQSAATTALNALNASESNILTLITQLSTP